MVLFWVVSCVVALGLGIWLGLPGRYEQPLDDVERTMTAGLRRSSRRTKRHFTPLAWIKRKAQLDTPASRRRRGGFRLDRPDER